MHYNLMVHHFAVNYFYYYCLVVYPRRISVCLSVCVECGNKSSQAINRTFCLFCLCFNGSTLFCVLVEIRP